MSIHTGEQLEHHAEQVRLLPEEMKRARRTKTSPLYQLNYEFDRYSAAREREDRVEHNARTILSHSGALLLLAQGGQTRSSLVEEAYALAECFDEHNQERRQLMAEKLRELDTVERGVLGIDTRQP